MKDKEWLKEQVDELFHAACEIGKMEYHEADQSVYVINGLVDQLDEPEIEENFYTFDNAKKWLQDNGFVVFEKDKLDEEVQRMVDETYDATNEKPVIPQFVADWIEKAKDEHSISWLMNYENIKHRSYELTLWCFESGNDDNLEKMAKAYLFGYRVEKEPQWVVLRNCMYIKNFYFGEMNDDYRVGSIAYKEQAMLFNDKAKAEAVALLVDGEVEEVTE